MNSMTRIDRSVNASLAVSKRSASKSARTNDFTNRTPATFSCRSALTMPTFSLASLYAREEYRRNTTVATTTNGSATKAISASPRSMTASTTAIPTKVTSETTEVTSPVCRNADSASTSVVIRVMIRPAISRS